MRFKCLVFDLDDTIIDTTRVLLPIANTPDFFARIHEPLPLLEGARENLIKLSEKYMLVLITQGDVKVQQQKVQSSGVAQYFTKLKYVAAAPGNKTLSLKVPAFFETLQELNIHGPEMLAIGNRVRTDLRPAKALKGVTCHLAYGEYKLEVPELPEDFPDFRIFHHQELIAKCQL